MKSFKVLLSFFLLTSQLWATHIFYVKTAEYGGNDSNYGRSWSTAYADVQKAIDAAAAVATEAEPAQVWIAKGTYASAGGNVSSTAYVMKNNVEIYGGFSGTETSLEERVSGNETILTTSGYYVFYNNYSSSNKLTSTAKIDAVTISGAKSRGIYNSYASPTITNCTISGNGEYGIANDSSSPTITNCTITGNEYGIFNSSSSSPTITNCTITGNSAGIDNSSSSSPTITNCTITGNSAGISNKYSSNSTITNCTITGNGSTGIDNSNSSSPTITNCTITGNSAGISNKYSSNSTITNCIIWGNTSWQISNYYSTPIVSYSIIEGGYSDGTNIITEDPMFGELGNYGGFVDTIPVWKGSSTICAGTTGENIPTMDARGVIRANPPAIGAYEYDGYHEPTYATIALHTTTIYVGKEFEIIVKTNGVDCEYVLYENGVEITRQDTNIFSVIGKDGKITYHVGIVCNGTELRSEAIEVSAKLPVFYVSTSGNDENDGLSWKSAFAGVQKAIDEAAKVATDAAPWQVWIAKGTYTRSSYYKMKNNVEIYGGFAGTEIKLDERVTGNETILTTTGDYVFYNDYSAPNKLTNTAKLDSMTITGAKFIGICNSYATPRITHCTITGNNTGIYNDFYSSPTITNCTIYGNGYYGIYNSYSDPTITNCTISGNGDDGICNEFYCSPRITNCTISGNDGDGIYNGSPSDPTIINCIIWGNTSQQIYNYSSYSSTPIVSYCVIEGGYPDGTNIITEDPLLGELGNYGGFVDVIPVLKGSSAIGAGTTGENIPTTDARGVNRANPPTIGAYEYFVQTSFDVWAQDNNLTGENAKPEAIPHSDGITNLEKFTFGLDASKATSYAESGLFKQISYGTNVSFQYPVNKAATDVAVKALVSEDLVYWTEATATKSGESGNMNIFEVKKPIPESGKLFFKVEVNQ